MGKYVVCEIDLISKKTQKFYYNDIIELFREFIIDDRYEEGIVYKQGWLTYTYGVSDKYFLVYRNEPSVIENLIKSIPVEEVKILFIRNNNLEKLFE